MNRAFEIGWRNIIMIDSRRGVWIKNDAQTMEICAGREGDDKYVKLKVGEKLDEEKFNSLKNILNFIDGCLEVTFGTNDLDFLQEELKRRC